jgi:hypothetical protein
MANNWRTIHPVPDKNPPLQDEEGGGHQHKKN